MKIEIGLNKKSIKNAIKQLRTVKYNFDIARKDFLEGVALWLIERANFYLSNSDIGEIVKLDIRNGWIYDFTPIGVKITNSAEKAVYVEFGVGVVGQSQSHPNASAEGYEYNVESASKNDDGSWTFFTNKENLDLPKNSIFVDRNFGGSRGRGGEYGERLQITTRGAKGVWYAYNAIVDAKMELAKPNGGEIGLIWQKSKMRYIK